MNRSFCNQFEELFLSYNLIKETAHFFRMSIAKTPSFLKEVLVEVGIIAQDSEVRLVVDVFKSFTFLEICLRRILENNNNYNESNFNSRYSVSAKCTVISMLL